MTAHAVRAARRPPTVAGDQWLLRYLSIPFVERGRSFGGADCWGHHLLILEHERGVRVPEAGELYASTSIRNAEGLRDYFAGEVHRWRRIVDPEPFACLLFGVRVAGRDLPAHVGTSLGGTRFIHTRAGLGPQMADLAMADRGEARWGDRLLGAYVYDA